MPMGQSKWTIQRNRQHWLHKTQKQNHYTICVEHNYTQINTNNVGKDESNIAYKGELQRTSQHAIMIKRLNIPKG